jgi:hypothetical protein
MEQPPNHAVLEASSEAEQVQDAKEFYEKHNHLFNDHVVQAGHDFWFTRQGHGVGFWEVLNSTVRMPWNSWRMPLKM